MSKLYRNLIQEINGNKPKPVQPAKKSVDEIAKEVINGQWGNGQDRINRLTQAGYNYNEVQRKVNEILGANLYYPMCDKKFNSIVDALQSIGVDSSFANRKQIAAKNNVRNYIGTAQQNNQMLAKLKAGKLLKK
jgi:hypothetical protein